MQIPDCKVIFSHFGVDSKVGVINDKQLVCEAIAPKRTSNVSEF